jgi:hypothetical protein
MVAATPFEWPPLPAQGFIRGRLASEADVAAGHAVFSLQPQPGLVPALLHVTIPQYAFHCDREAGSRTPGIVIQAEQAAGAKIIGMRRLPDGALLAGLLDEFELLGDSPPRQR